MDFSDLVIGNKYYFMFSETDLNGVTRVTLKHDELIGVMIEKSRVFAGKTSILIRTPTHTLNAPNIIGETAKEAYNLYSKHMREFIIPTLETIEKLRSEDPELEDDA